MANRYAQIPEPIALNDCRLSLGQAHAGAPRIVTAADWLTSPEAPAVADLAMLAPHPRLRLLPIDDQHVVAFVPSLVGAAVLNAPAVDLLQRLPLSDPHERAAHVGAIAALNRLGLLTGAPHEPPPPPPEVLLAWMHVTNACNLRCAYCYIEQSAEQMSAETALGAVEAVIRAARAHGYRQIALKYAGGEPLLALDVVEVLQRYAQERTRAAGLGLQATLLTNGLALTDEAAARLRDLG
ncbi:MAG: radical SAM protein, partial [Oscillochloris sp.]|nr:radical SAM protein [Oscillochloris sp.]